MSKTALIADDSRFSRKAVISELTSVLPGVECREASDGAEALDLARSESFDFILLDLNMPQVDGFEFLRSLKKDGVEARVIVLSANFQPKAFQRVKELGAIDFIKKPPKANKLKHVLERNNLL